MGADQGDPRFAHDWEDDDEPGDGQAQCATQ